MDAHQTHAATGSAYPCIHEYVERPFRDVVRMLRGDPVLLGIAGRRSADGFRVEFVHERLASLPVTIDDLDASLLVVQIVGGTQQPVTELILARAPAGSALPDASAARHFVDDLVHALETELGANSRPAVA